MPNMSDQLLGIPVKESRYEPRIVDGGMPTDCCKYGVVDVARGIEICRVWDEEDARRIARLLNADAAARAAAMDALIAQSAHLI